MDLLQRRNKVAAPGAPQATAAPATPAAPAAPRQQGSGFVGFDRYFQANQEGAQAMAKRVGDTVEQRAQTGAGAIQGATDTFNSKSQGLTYDPKKAPTADDAQKLAGTTYTGPKDWAEAGVDTGAVQEKVNAGQAAVAGLGSAGGLASLLREGYRAPVAAGASMLDAALTGAAGGDRFSKLQAQFGDLEKHLTDTRAADGKVFDANLAATKEAAAKYGELVPGLAKAEQRAAERAAFDAGVRNNMNGTGASFDPTTGQWTRDEADTLDDLKRGPRTPRRQVRG